MLKAFRAYKINGVLNSEVSLNEYQYHQCTEQEVSRMGFVSVIDDLTHSLNGRTYFKVKREKKQIPASSVAEKLKVLIDAFEAEHGQKPSRRDKGDMKEKVMIELASRALSSYSTVEGWFDNDYVVVLTSSSSTAEDVLALLRKALGSLPVSHAMDNQKLSEAMQKWFSGSELPSNVTLGNEAKLSSCDEEKSSATIKNGELNSEEIQALLNCRRVVSLELCIADKGRFVVKDDGTIAKISLSDVTIEQHQENVGDTEDDAARLEADLILKADIVDVILGAMSSVKAEA